MEVHLPALLLFLFYFSVTQSEGSARPMVTFTPDWKDIFIYDSVTITCHVGSTAEENQRYYWYKDGKRILGNNPSFTIESADDTNRGEYQCATNPSHKSHPVKLGVSSYPLILQSPTAVYEGQPLTLRCRAYPADRTMNTTFYKDGDFMKFTDADEHLHFAKVDFSTSGRYRCTKVLHRNEKYEELSAETTVSVQEKVQSRRCTCILAMVGTALFPLVTLAVCFYTSRVEKRNKEQIEVQMSVLEQIEETPLPPMRRD